MLTEEERQQITQKAQKLSETLLLDLSGTDLEVALTALQLALVAVAVEAAVGFESLMTLLAKNMPTLYRSVVDPEEEEQKTAKTDLAEVFDLSAFRKRSEDES